MDQKCREIKYYLGECNCVPSFASTVKYIDVITLKQRTNQNKYSVFGSPFLALFWLL